jgi:quercetin dioxygenase-like cupin family protein
MRIVRVVAGVFAALVCILAPGPSPSASGTKPTPLILEKNEGERRVFRGWPGHPTPGSAFILKVDPKNGGSSHLVFGTEDLRPGEEIPTHRHPGADEILYLENGAARVHLGETVRDVVGSSTVFIPAGTWISVKNTGRNAIHLAFVFSAPGFEDFMRAESVREGEKNVPVSKAEDDEIQRKHAHAVVYR